ncbi:MAG: hypothetical protein CMJ78_14085 [Planctomycetaceae bacterium]|nr:hypothetical protein [Planctomycetaceae bacterium]
MATDLKTTPTAWKQKLLTACLLTWLATCGGLCVYIEEPFISEKTWEKVGLTQVVEWNDELWCFVQINQMVLKPGKLSSPNSYAIGYRHEVVVFNSEGVSRRIRNVSIRKSIHPYIHAIRSYEDGLYTIQQKEWDSAPRVYIWNDDHFEPAPRQEEIELLGKIDSSEEGDAKDLAAVFFKNRWTRDEEFEWRQRKFEFQVKYESPKMQLHVHGESWSDLITETDLTRRPID